MDRNAFLIVIGRDFADIGDGADGRRDLLNCWVVAVWVR